MQPPRVPLFGEPLQGLSEVVPQLANTNSLVLFVPKRSALVGTPPVPKHTAPAPVHRRGTHSGGSPGWLIGPMNWTYSIGL